MATPASAVATMLAACLLAAPACAQGTPEESALLVARQLSEGRFSDIVLTFTPEMTSALPASKLAQAWGDLAARAGPVRETGTLRSAQSGAATVVTVPLRFEKGAVDLVVTIAAGRIAGLLIKPVESPPQPWTSAAYNNPSAYRDIDVLIGTAPTTLPGTLALPRTTNRVAAAVLVHGSGPHDRNETIGPNRPFQDLAEGLASRGIAVLRYEKRTKIYPQSFAATRTFTVREEVIDDALAAVALLRARPEIDPRKIVVLGHSLGGMLAPRIAKEDNSIAAIIILAGAARPIPDLIVEQTEYLAGLDGPPDDKAKAQIASIKAEAARARAAKAEDTGPPLLNAPPSYWADLNAYDPAATASTLTVPTLILQGGRDYQVTSKDFERFQSVLAGRSNVTLRMLPHLNHLFVAGEGPSTPVEYRRPSHVDLEVIEAIASFINHLPDL